MRKLLLLLSHGAMLAVGFALGIYALPILTAPEPPAANEVARDSGQARYTTEFVRDLADSDFLHWGEGTVYLHDDRVALDGALSPGPDFRLYFSPQFVETETDFLRLKSTMRDAGDVKTFENFMVDLPGDLDLDDYTTVIVWCESFNQFITAAEYR